MELTRRRLLGLGAGMGTGLLLAACGGGQAAPAGGPTGAPRPGGMLRAGALGSVGAAVRDPHASISNESDFLILALVHDALTVPGAQQTAPRLASSWEASPDQRSHRFVIAEGATFHDGAPVTSDDVVWSLRRLRGMPAGASRLPGVAPEAITADGPGAVVLTSEYPNSDLPMLIRLNSFVLKKDTPDPAGSPGTGPFRLESYEQGNARLVRNDTWHGGPPQLDGIEVRIFDSAQSMSNALLTGEIDLASNVGPIAARTAQGRDGIQIVRRANDASLPIVMRVSDGPFADVRVREALRLAVDREALVTQALSGFGTVANDVMGTGDPAYDRDLPQRTRDLARAGALLDEAGFDRSVRHQLFTADEAPGQADAATLFAAQVQEVGVGIDVIRQDSNTFYDQTWLKAALYTAYWGTNDSVTFFAAKTMLSASGQNEAGQQDADFDAAYQQAVGAPDAQQRADAVRLLQQIQFERSGYLLWGMADGVDLAASNVGGLPTLPGYGRVQLERAWLAT
jgi:peptide/nickel transport system substrate-binding protein